MATHCSNLAWRVPWTEEPDGRQSTGSQRVKTGLKRLAHTHGCTYLLYNLVSTSAAPHPGPAVCIHTPLPSWASLSLPTPLV